MIVKLLCFVLLFCGILLFFKVSPKELLISFAEILSGLIFGGVKNKNTLAYRVNLVKKNKKPFVIKKIILDANNILILQGKQNRLIFYISLSIILFIVGIVFCLILKNYLLLPILSVSFFLFPFFYIIFTRNAFIKKLNENLEITLSLITNSYMRTNNIVTSVKENLESLENPLRLLFVGFISKTELGGQNIEHALENLKGRIPNKVFDEWLNILIVSQNNSDVKRVLPDIVNKLSDNRVLTLELNEKLYEPIKEFSTMSIFCLLNIPIIYVLNKSWFSSLMFSAIGKGIRAITVLIIVIGIYKLIRISRPINYE